MQNSTQMRRNHAMAALTTIVALAARGPFCLALGIDSLMWYTMSKPQKAYWDCKSPISHAIDRCE